MGLLNNFFGSPDQTQALGLLGVGMMNGGFGQGAGMAMQHLAGAGDRNMQRELGLLRMEEARMNMEQARQAQVARQKMQEAARSSFVSPERATAMSMGPMPDGSNLPQVQPGFNSQQFLNKMFAIDPLQALEMQKQFAPAERINKLDAKDFTPESVQRFQQSGNYADLVRLDKLHFADTGGRIAGLNPFTGQQVGGVEKTGNPFNDLLVADASGALRPNTPLIGAKSQIANAGASRISVNNRQESEEAKAVGKFFGESYADVQKSGLTAQSSINRINRLDQLLNGVDTGKFAPLGLEVAKAAQTLGVNIDPNLSNKEAAVALSSEIALQLRNPSGGAGMPGAMSDADRNFLAGMVPGIEKTPEGRKKIIETARKLAQRDIEVAQKARAYRQKTGTINEGFYDELARHAEANPLFGGQSGGSPAKPSMRFNPSTGKLEPVK